MQTDPDRPYARVLVAIDDPQTAGPMLAAALALAPRAELFAVHAFETGVAEKLAGQTEPGRKERHYEAGLGKALAEATKRGPVPALTARRHAIVAEGDALTVLGHEKPRRWLTDLVVMGTRHGAAWFGSHAVDTIFWCPTDLMIVPERGG